MSLDVAVVGAGLSGLTSARELERRGARALVLEARDRVGGRTLSQPLGKEWIDLGAQWIGPTQHRVSALAEELGVKSFLQFHSGKKLLELGGKRSTYRGLVPSVSPLSLVETGIGMARIEWLARTVPLARPGDAARAEHWDAITARDWLERSLHTSGARSLLTIATEMIFAAEPEDLSFLFFLTYLHSGGGIKRMAEVNRGAQHARLVGGAQQLSQKLAARLREPVRLSEPVLAIAQDESGVTLRTPRGELRAQSAIVALPPALCQRIEFSPALPQRRIRLHENMPMGSVIKCVAGYSRAFWREAGLSGEAITDGSPIRAVFDDTSHDESEPALVAFIVGSEAKHWSERPPEERKQAVIDHLARLFGDAAKTPTHYVDKDWRSDEWSAGCYAGVFGTGVLGGLGSALSEPWGRVSFAGTETAEHWMGYLDGAIEAGERAAREVLARLKLARPL